MNRSEGGYQLIDKISKTIPGLSMTTVTYLAAAISHLSGVLHESPLEKRGEKLPLRLRGSWEKLPNSLAIVGYVSGGDYQRAARAGS